MDKNKLIEILKNKELSEKLMEDESFKKELKEILKDDVPNVTDEQLKEILSNLGNTLSKEFSDDKFLENVSGGVNGLLRQTTYAIICMVGVWIGDQQRRKKDKALADLAEKYDLFPKAKPVDITKFKNAKPIHADDHDGLVRQALLTHDELMNTNLHDAFMNTKRNHSNK